jgi:hypothetical protein
MAFTVGTIDTLYGIYGWDATSSRYRSIVSDRLALIEATSPTVIPQIELLIAQITTAVNNYDPTKRYLTKLDVLEWRNGKGLGDEDWLESLKLRLLALIGLTGFTGQPDPALNTGDGFGDGELGATFARRDHLRYPRTWWRRMAY